MLKHYCLKMKNELFPLCKYEFKNYAIELSVSLIALFGVYWSFAYFLCLQMFLVIYKYLVLFVYRCFILFSWRWPPQYIPSCTGLVPRSLWAPVSMGSARTPLPDTWRYPLNDRDASQPPSTTWTPSLIVASCAPGIPKCPRTGLLQSRTGSLSPISSSKIIKSK